MPKQSKHHEQIFQHFHPGQEREIQKERHNKRRVFLSGEPEGIRTLDLSDANEPERVICTGF